ncbi:ataxin-7-like protein 1 [Diachasma alloeum]|uniref:ataxin-7-like protein 1 n=1 Tax=Diachasma alloeum TaxID=454923 RepID=UPI0007384322|nr:ataxin-7-like protein 1 [Diachasma alloeum]
MSGSDSPTFFHGQPWSSWIERIGRDKPLSDEEPEVEPASCVTRLSADDIDLYGFCPERDTFYGVVCELCNAIVKPQALIQHMESRHSSGAVNLPPPSTPASKASVKTPYCKVSKLTKKAQPPQGPSASNSSGNGASGTSSTASNSSKINHTSVKRNAEQALLPTSPVDGNCSLVGSNISSGVSASATAPVPSSPVKSPGNNSSVSNTTTSNNGTKRKRLKADRGLLKDREYDPDRHCGVWNEETGKPCTRSLTCKAHTVSLRRTVAGRSKSFDKLLAEHRASKDLPNRTSKITVTGTVTVSTASALLNTNLTIANDNDAPGSPPVLSLPDTYPLPKAVDLLYRCLAPHGSTKPTKLEEDFVNEEMRLESTAAAVAGKGALPAGSMAPISVVLPSLSPIAASNDAPPVATLIPVNASSLPAIQTPLPPPNAQLPNTVLEGETLSDMKTESMTLYSPMAMFKDTKSQIIMQIPRSSSLMQSPISRNYQGQASMPSLVFEDQMDNPKQQLANGKRLNNHTVTSSPIAGRGTKKSKQDFQTENYSSAIQVETTTTSTAYPHFSDIAWSNCHPEPLAVSRWLRITSTRKQYNFNIH